MRKSGLFPILSLCLVCEWTGCMVGPSYVEPNIESGKSFGNEKEPEYKPVDVNLSWWKQFNDQKLTHLIEQAVKNNYDLKSAEANLREARAMFLDAGLNILPHINTHGSWTSIERSLSSLNGRSYVPQGLSLYNVGFDTFWEVDFWGRVRRDVQAKEAEIEASEADRQYLTLSVIAEIARNYFELRGHQNQLLVNERNAKNQEATWQYTVARQEAGSGTEFDSARAKAQYDTTVALIPPLESAIRRDIHRISILTGQIPSALLTELMIPAPIPKAPDKISIGNPADLLRRRPDVRAAEHSLASMTARIGVVTADLFPKVTFIGNLSLESSNLSGLGMVGSSSSQSFGPRITWPAFDSYQVYARIKAADARADAALAQYQQTVLNALEETENALVTYDRLRDRQALLKAAANESTRAYEIANIRFTEGIDHFLNLLDTERRLLLDQSEHAQSQTDTAAAMIALYKALGGGWEIFQTPEDQKRPLEDIFTP